MPAIGGLKRKGRMERERDGKKQQRSCFLLGRVGTGFAIWDRTVVGVDGKQNDIGPGPEPSLPGSWPLQVSDYKN